MVSHSHAQAADAPSTHNPCFFLLHSKFCFIICLSDDLKEILIQLNLVDNYFNRNDLEKNFMIVITKRRESYIITKFAKVFLLDLLPQCFEYFNQLPTLVCVERRRNGEFEHYQLHWYIWQRLSFHKLIKYAGRDLN